MLGHADVLALHDPETGEAVGRWTTTRAVRAQERSALGRRATGRSRAPSRRVGGDGPSQAALAAREPARGSACVRSSTAVGGRRPEDHRGPGGDGEELDPAGDARGARAGRAIGCSGLAPTNAVAQDLKAEGFAEAATVHSTLFRLKNGMGEVWDREHGGDRRRGGDAGYARVTGELLHEARRARGPR